MTEPDPPPGPANSGIAPDPAPKTRLAPALLQMFAGMMAAVVLFHLVEQEASLVAVPEARGALLELRRIRAQIREMREILDAYRKELESW